MAVKKREHEKLNSENLRRVISLMNPKEGKPITKKDACSILNISYNTMRLGKIISEWQEKQVYIAKRKSQNKGKPASEQEETEAITEYLTGETIANIAKGLFRSSGFIKSLIERVGVPQRPTSAEGKTNVDFLPDSCVANSFRKGEVVWSAKYNKTAIIIKEVKGNYGDKYASKCYHISVVEPVNAEGSFFPHIQSGGFSAYALAYDLGKLEHLKGYVVNLSKL